MPRLNIEQLITSPESKTLEFTQDLSFPRPMLKTLLAFAITVYRAIDRTAYSYSYD